MESLCALADTIRDMDEVEMRLAPDETAYIINLTGTEAEKVLAVTMDTAETLFETSVSCIGASICQVGVRDSQALLAASADPYLRMPILLWYTSDRSTWIQRRSKEGRWKNRVRIHALCER